jgi:hypothetical protein
LFGGEPLCAVQVELSASRADQLLHGADDTTARALLESRLLEVLLRWAVRRIVELIRAGTMPVEPTSSVELLRVDEGDLPLLGSMLGAKTCEYQRRDGRDLLCAATAARVRTAAGNLTERRDVVAPTSTAACLACELPDTDYVCSHLLHPMVTGVDPLTATRFPVRELKRAVCDRGRGEIIHPSKCRPDGHGCWSY